MKKFKIFYKESRLNLACIFLSAINFDPVVTVC
jgi:hypothetical protein